MRSAAYQSATTQAPSSSKRKAHAALDRGKKRTKSLQIGRETRIRREDDWKDSKAYTLDITFTGKTMPWPTLPYHILQAIFTYAAYPLVADNFSSNPSVPWLGRVARLCRGFAEPALSALYFAPPLFPPARVRRLIAHLEKQDNTYFTNYRTKVKRLDLEAVYITCRRSDGLDPIDLTRLLALTPQLRGVGIHLLSDEFGGVAHSFSGRALYQSGIVSSMTDTGIRLRDWTWNSALAGGNDYSLLHLKSIHQTSAFRFIQSLTFINYDSGSFRVVDRKPETGIKLFGEALESMLALRRLAFIYSPILSDALFLRLPSTLQIFEVTDCQINSLQIKRFLLEKGSALRRLVLDHNRHLNLSWLPVLASSSPQLEILKMDLIYHNQYASVSDSDPKYAYLLLPDERPTWPATLQRLELYHLRKCSTTVAELFFSSLVESASSLPDLRQVKIKASLDESGWRDRVAFRDRWINKLKQVFLRKSASPKPYLKSLAAFRAHKARRSNAKSSQHVPVAKIQRIEVPIRLAKVPSGNSNESDSDKPLASRRHTRRTRTKKNYNENSPGGPDSQARKRRRRRPTGTDESSEEDSALEDDTIYLNTPATSNNDAEESLYIQGMCDVVDVMIDNLRPTEEQLHESDFLDEEASGDEDWNGDDDIPGDGKYAW